MPIQDKATGYSSLPDAQQKQGSSLKDKVSGAVNVIHGTGEVIRGHALETGDFGHGNGNGKAIIAAGRDEVQRGLDKIEGKTTATSAAGYATYPDRVGDGTGAAPRLDSTAPQATTAASRADPTTEKNGGYAADTRRFAEQGTASAAVNDTYGHTPQQYRDKDRGTTPPLPLRPTAADDQNVQRDTDLRQHGNRTVPGGFDEATATTGATADGSYPANAVGQEQPTVTPSLAY